MVTRTNGRAAVRDAMKAVDKPPGNGHAKDDKPKRELRMKSMPDAPAVIQSNSLDEYQYVIDIIGTSTLISHSKKGVHIGEGGQLPKGKSRPPFDVIGVFKNACYMLPGATFPRKPIQPNGFWPYKPNTFGHPAVAFKRAVISAALQETNLHRDLLGTRMRVIGMGKDPNLAILKYESVRCRYEHLPNPSSFPKTLMPVSRAEFFGWSTKLIFKVSVRLFDPKQFGRILTLAGEWIGVGDSRLERSQYEHGTFQVGKTLATRIEHSDIGFVER